MRQSISWNTIIGRIYLIDLPVGAYVSKLSEPVSLNYPLCFIFLWFIFRRFFLVFFLFFFCIRFVLFSILSFSCYPFFFVLFGCVLAMYPLLGPSRRSVHHTRVEFLRNGISWQRIQQLPCERRFRDNYERRGFFGLMIFLLNFLPFGFEAIFDPIDS